MFRAAFFLALLALVFVIVFSVGFTFLQHLQGLSAQQPAKTGPLIINFNPSDAETKPNPAPAAPSKPAASKSDGPPSKPIVSKRQPATAIVPAPTN